jgi:hypothetical protein
VRIEIPCPKTNGKVLVIDTQKCTDKVKNSIKKDLENNISLNKMKDVAGGAMERTFSKLVTNKISKGEALEEIVTETF